jgi:hypothetical protein
MPDLTGQVDRGHESVQLVHGARNEMRCCTQRLPLVGSAERSSITKLAKSSSPSQPIVFGVDERG